MKARGVVGKRIVRLHQERLAPEDVETEFEPRVKLIYDARPELPLPGDPKRKP
jgi:hypothetical protein